MATKASGSGRNHLAGKLAGLAKTQARRLRKNELSFALQTAPVPPGAFLQPFHHLVTGATYQNPGHKMLSTYMPSK